MCTSDLYGREGGQDGRRIADRPPRAGLGRKLTSRAVWARVGSRRRDTGLTRSPSASRVSTPSNGSPPGSSSAVMGAVRRSISIPIVQARRRRRDPSASETAKRVGSGAAPAARATAVGTIVYVAPVSTRKRTRMRRRANTSASTYTCPMPRPYHGSLGGGTRSGRGRAHRIDCGHIDAVAAHSCGSSDLSAGVSDALMPEARVPGPRHLRATRASGRGLRRFVPTRARGPAAA